MLVTTLDEINEYIPSNSIQRFEVVQSFIEAAEEKEIIPIIGQELYDALSAAYVDSDISEEMQALLPYVQRPIIHFAFYDAVPLLDVSLSGSGFAVVQTSTHAPASAARVENFRKGVKKSAYDGIELLLAFLEKNKSDYEQWTSSEAYTEQNAHIIRTASEFNKHVFIDKSRLIFLKLLPVISEVENLHIAGHISQELLDEIVSQVKSGNLSTANKLVYNQIVPALANLTMAEGIDLVANSIYGEGIVTHYNIGTTSTADLSRVETLRQKFGKAGMAYLSKARGIILANVDNYAKYKASDLYDSTVTEVEAYIKNDEDKQTFIFGGGYAG